MRCTFSFHITAFGLAALVVSCGQQNMIDTPTSGGGNDCVPDCSGKTCGDDGCGGACGICDVGNVCTNNACIPELVGGWNDLSPQADTRSIYVDPTGGSDANDGLSPATAKQTIAAAFPLLRNGYPDHLYLKRGEEFFEGLGNWTISGRSSSEPMVVTSYGSGTARPHLKTGDGHGATVHGGGVNSNHVVFADLHFTSHTNVGDAQSNAFSILEPVNDWVIEGCKIEKYFVGIVLQGVGGRHQNVRMRRNVIVDAVGSGHAQGIYIDNSDDVLVEENVLDHNGWNTSGCGNCNADIFRHNVYVQAGSTGVVLRGNIIARGSSHGAQMRSGGVAENNLFLQNAINLLIGSDLEPNGVSARMVGNVFLDGRDIDADSPRGWVADLNWFNGTSEIAYNIAAHNENGLMPKSFSFYLPSGLTPTINFHHNISYNWGAPVKVGGSGPWTMTMANNDAQEYGTAAILQADSLGALSGLTSTGNRLYSGASASQWVYTSDGAHKPLEAWMTAVGDVTSSAALVTYPNPDRTIADYDAGAPYAGAGTLEDFLAQARKQSKSNWRDKFVGTHAVEHFRQNFGMTIP